MAGSERELPGRQPERLDLKCALPMLSRKAGIAWLNWVRCFVFLMSDEAVQCARAMIHHLRQAAANGIAHCAPAACDSKSI